MGCDQSRAVVVEQQEALPSTEENVNDPDWFLGKKSTKKKKRQEQRSKQRKQEARALYQQALQARGYPPQHHRCATTVLTSEQYQQDHTKEMDRRLELDQFTK